jgi:hypothetical protein
VKLQLRPLADRHPESGEEIRALIAERDAAEKALSQARAYLACVSGALVDDGVVKVPGASGYGDAVREITARAEADATEARAAMVEVVGAARRGHETLIAERDRLREARAEARAVLERIFRGYCAWSTCERAARARGLCDRHQATVVSDLLDEDPDALALDTAKESDGQGS